MNLPPNVARCVCSKIRNSPRICWEDDGFQEKDKQVKLRARSGETVKAVVVDGYLLTDEQTKKCDGLFVLIGKKEKNRRQKIYIVLVELKGTHIDDAFDQFASVKHCPEYQKIVEHFAKEINSSKPVRPIERSFIVTSAKMPPRLWQEKLERSYGIRVDIRMSARTKAKALDLRKDL